MRHPLSMFLIITSVLFIGLMFSPGLVLFLALWTGPVLVLSALMGLRDL